MSLIIDKQTADDLAIFGQRGKESVFGLFNKTATAGGATLLEEWFTYPLSKGSQIEERAQTIGHFIAHPAVFPFETSLFDQALFYLDMADERSRLHQGKQTLKEKMQALLGADDAYKKVIAGLVACSAILHGWRNFLEQSQTQAAGTLGRQLKDFARRLEGSALESIPLLDEKKKIDRQQVILLDNILRFEEKDLFQGMLRDIYTLDVYISAASVARERNFALPKIIVDGSDTLRYEAVFHPLVPQAKGNSLSMDRQHNITFLTGANMAGKSTFMKSLGIALFLAHLGFPVPAKSLEFSPREAIYTSINLPDNIQMGYSHFYAEVLRVKKVAQQLAEGKKLFVIFDEMFRGTNVKDAYEGTVAVVAKLYQHPGCQFVISTHILEAGEALQHSHPDIRYVFLPTILKNGIPHYTYLLQEGITADRHGMVIIQNEGILDILISKESKRV